MKIDRKFLIILFLALLRLIDLPSDPGILSYLREPLFRESDEVFWTYEARNQVLFNNWHIDNYGAGFVAAPLFTILANKFFSVVGVSLFTVKLLGAMPSVILILLFYLALSKYDRNIAFIASLILALDPSFFALSRLGYPVALRFLTFLISICVLETNFKWKNTISGLIYGVAILVNINSLFFLPIILLYLAFRFINKSISFNDLKDYLVGLLISGLFILLYYTSIQKEQLTWFSSIAATSSQSLLNPIRFIQFFGLNPYFQIPSVFLLSIVSLVYLFRSRIQDFVTDPINKIKTLSPIQVFAYSWFFGTLLYTFFLSDLNLGRFDPLIFPLCIFSALQFNGYKSPTNSEKSKKFNFNITLLLFILLLSGLAYMLGKLFFSINYSKALDILSVSKLQIAVIAFAVIVLILYFVYKTGIKKLKEVLVTRLPKLITLSIIVLLVFLMLDRLYSLYEFSTYSKLTAEIKFVLSTFVSILIFYAFQKFPEALARYSLYFFIFSSVCLVAYYLAYPSYSIKNASLSIASISEYSDGITGSSHSRHFILESNSKFVYWNPKSTNSINSDAIAKIKPRFFVETITINGDPVDTSKFVSKNDLNETLSYLGDYGLNEVFGRPQIHTKFYEIIYKS